MCYKYNHKFYLNNKLYRYIYKYLIISLILAITVLLFTYYTIVKVKTLVSSNNKIIFNILLLDQESNLVFYL